MWAAEWCQALRRFGTAHAFGKEKLMDVPSISSWPQQEQQHFYMDTNKEKIDPVRSEVLRAQKYHNWDISKSKLKTRTSPYGETDIRNQYVAQYYIERLNRCRYNTSKQPIGV